MSGAKPPLPQVFIP